MQNHIKTHKIFCPHCGTHTDQVHMVDRFGTQCTRCHRLISSLERADTESNQFLTPDGKVAKVVENSEKQVVFSVDEGEHSGYYVYDKATGFGAIQNRGEIDS